MSAKLYRFGEALADMVDRFVDARDEGTRLNGYGRYIFTFRRIFFDSMLSFSR
jgi:hypothetical protein